MGRPKKVDQRHFYSSTHEDVVRPGIVIHGVLAEQIDLIDGVYVQEASVAELWCAYKRQLYLENSKKPEVWQQPGLNLRSFRNYLWMAHGLKLIKAVKVHPPDYQLYADSARYLSEEDFFAYTHGMRKVYKLTPKGFGSRDWNRISTVYHEKFPGKKKLT